MNSFKDIIKELDSYNSSLFTKIEDEDVSISIKNSIKMIMKIQVPINNKNYTDYFKSLSIYKFNLIVLNKIINKAFDKSIYNENLSNTFVLELTKNKINMINMIKLLEPIDKPIDVKIDNITITDVNKIFLSSFINIQDPFSSIELINIIDSKISNLDLDNVIIDEYVEFMNDAINIDEALVDKIREDNINLLFNCKLNKINIDVKKNNLAIQTYNFIPIKYAKSISQLLNLPNNLSNENIAKFLSKKYNKNICLVIDSIVGNDIEYKIPTGNLNNINVNDEFIEQSRTLIYSNYSAKNEYKHSTQIYGKQNDDSSYIYIRNCDSGNFALMNNIIDSNNYIIRHSDIKNLLNNNISNRIHCYYRNENIIQENIFNPDLIMNLNYNIKFVPELIKLTEFLSFISDMTSKEKEYNADKIEEPIINYFMTLFKNDSYIKNELKPVIIYLLKREMKMIKRDIFSHKKLDQEEYKKIILSYFVDGKFIDRLSTRYNIIYANRKDRDIYVTHD